MRDYYDTIEQIARRLLKVFAVALSKTPAFFKWRTRIVKLQLYQVESLSSCSRA